MKDIYLYLLFILVSIFAYSWLGREHLTIEERVGTLEDEYTDLHNIVETQEQRMSGASSQATTLKANMTSIAT